MSEGKTPGHLMNAAAVYCARFRLFILFPRNQYVRTAVEDVMNQSRNRLSDPNIFFKAVTYLTPALHDTKRADRVLIVPLTTWSNRT